MTVTTAFKQLTKDDIAEVLGTSLRTIEDWINKYTLPIPKKIGSRVYWRPTVFYTWLDQRLRADSEDEGEKGGVPAQQEARVEKGNSQKSRALSTKTELDQLRLRDQAKLDSMLA